MTATVQGLNHIGVAVESIDDQRGYYEDVLGATFESTQEVPSQQVRVAFFRVGEARIELLEPTDPQSPIARFLAKRGQGLHHLAFTVDDIETRIAEIKAGGLRMIDDKPRVGAHQMRIAFLHPKSTFGVLTELCQPQPPSEK